MQIFDIGFSHGDSFIWSDTPPDGYKGIIIPGASFHTLAAGCGHMAMQHLQRPQFSIWHSSYLMKSKRRTHVRADYSALEFSLIIENGALYDLNTFGRIDQRETQFNISFMTEIDSKVTFEAGKHYTTLDIHCTFSFIERLASAYPEIIYPLLDDMLAGRQRQVFPRYIYATKTMMELAGGILRMLVNISNEFVLERTVQLLIAIALSCRMEMLQPSSLNNFDRVDKMNMIATTLLKDLSVFPHIPVIAKLAHMNETTFKKIFKEIHQMNPHQFWSQNRLQTAFDKVVNSRMTLTEIAFEMGFGSIQSFSKEFKKQYKKPPSNFRKKE